MEVPRAPKGDCVRVHFEIMATDLSQAGNLDETLHCLPPRNRRTDRKLQPDPSNNTSGLTSVTPKMTG